ncbi:MAG: DUF4238 domain-containing protein [Pseudomonadaceae bacterium]|nr:DUF4238 domain-containing protein [Pseudomonadaceae bacterium]
MPSNKNQHFVPRSYLRAFSPDEKKRTINLFNLDRERLILGASIKHQCSGDYFYGDDEELEEAIQLVERSYAEVVNDIERYEPVTALHQTVLRRFWLLQFLRTDAAARRSVEMTDAIVDFAGPELEKNRFSIKDAVQTGMQIYAEQMSAIDDLKICIVKNNSKTPFITSDNPATLTNRWHFQDSRTNGSNFGLTAAGALAVLPISPKILMLAYDGDVYSIQKNRGWVQIKGDNDVDALNQLQILNCWANIYLRDDIPVNFIADCADRCRGNRPTNRYIIDYAVLKEKTDEGSIYRTVAKEAIPDGESALVHSQSVYGEPTHWPAFVRYRKNGTVYYNGSAVGYVRRAPATARGARGFRQLRSRQIPPSSV